MPEQLENTRNEALEFARRTRRNLEYIEKASEEDHPVHPVTQLTLSLLGLVVFPKEKLYLEEAKAMTVDKLRANGWPEWTISLDNTDERSENLWVILWHLRNATCHGRLIYSSDSRDMEDVTIIVEDKMPRAKEPYWRASIQAKELRTFCYHLLDFIEQTIG